MSFARFGSSGVREGPSQERKGTGQGCGPAETTLCSDFLIQMVSGFAQLATRMSTQTPNLFRDIVVDAPPTEGIKYAGSKLKLLPYILLLIQKVKPHTVLDGFSGTTRVSQALAQTGHRVIANDLSVWSEVFGKCYLLNAHPSEHYQRLIDHLNALPGR